MCTYLNLDIDIHVFGLTTLPKNCLVRFPLYFTDGILGITSQNPENFVKI